MLQNPVLHLFDVFSNTKYYPLLFSHTFIQRYLPILFAHLKSLSAIQIKKKYKQKMQNEQSEKAAITVEKARRLFEKK